MSTNMTVMVADMIQTSKQTIGLRFVLARPAVQLTVGKGMVHVATATLRGNAQTIKRSIAERYPRACESRTCHQVKQQP
jgi:hypothetical protein